MTSLGHNGMISGSGLFQQDIKFLHKSPVFDRSARNNTSHMAGAKNFIRDSGANLSEPMIAHC